MNLLCMVTPRDPLGCCVLRACCLQGDMLPEVDVDARPSDAINLAVRFGAPL